MKKYSTSYGLVVKTKDHKVVLIKRKIPYCVQNFLMSEGKNLNIYNYQELFIKNYFHKLNYFMKLDFLNFCFKFKFEDEYDYPHGQKRSSGALKNAIREFKEETGLKFKNKEKIYARTLKFIGLDGCYYQQIYFIITVENLERCYDKKHENFFETLIIDIDKAKELLENQQLIKRDDKHLLLN